MMHRLGAVCVLLFLLPFVCHAAENITSGGSVIAVLASGDVNDFGYNFIINEGRVKMERALNITGTKWCPNIKTEAQALEKISELVSLGFRLIISTTTDHGAAAVKAAELYPTISFVQSGGTSTLPNLSVLAFNGPDMYYAAGIFCGLQSKVGKVGFVHPGPPMASFGTLNAFFSGVKKANRNAEVYVVFTKSFLDADRAAGACDILVNKTGVDMLAGQQDDFTVQTAAMANNMLAVGVNGYPLRNLFGEAIGMSVLRRWDVPLTTFARMVLANTTDPIRKDITASFASGITLLDTPSYRVPDDTWAEMLATQERFKNSTGKPYFCTEWVASLGVRSDGCLLNNTKFTSVVLPDIIDLGTYTVPLEDIPFPNGTRIAVIVLVALLLLCTAAISVALYVLRRDAVILASSPVFMGLIIVGVAMVFAAAIAWVESPNDSSCTARIWLPSLGFTLCMGAMIIKNVRLWIIFDAEMKRVRIRNIKLLLWTGVLLALSIVLLSLWTGLGKPHVEYQQGTAGLGKYQTRKLCATSARGDHILYSIIALHASQLLVGCFVTFKIRVIDIEEFNESRPFGLCIYVVSLVLTIAGILIGTGGITNVQQIVIIVAFSLLIGSAAVLFLIFAPKFLTIFVKGERPMSRVMRGVAMTASRSSNNSGSKNDSGTSSTVSVSAVQTSASGKTVVITDQV